MSRVVLCVQNLPVPRDRRVWREAQTLAEAGHEVTVISPQTHGLPAREFMQGIEILRYPDRPANGGVASYITESLNALWYTTRLSLRLRRSGRIDVLHAANPPDTFFLLGALLRPLGTRFVYDQHDLSPELAAVKWPQRRGMQRLMLLLERLSYALADLVIASNDSYRHAATTRGRVPPARVTVVRNGPDAVMPPVPGIPYPPLRVVFAGIMGAQDDVDVLLDAAAQVLHRRPGSIHLDMVGTGDSLWRLQEHARSLGIESAITWTGWLDGPEYRARVATAHVGVSPDRDDAFNRQATMMKVADYLSLGLACLAADLPETRVAGGDAVVYFRPGDPADLAARLESLLERPDLVEEMRTRARRRAPQLLWHWSAERLVASYDRLLASPRADVSRATVA